MKRNAITRGLIFAATAISLASCGQKPMTNDEVIAAVKTCERAGLRPVPYYISDFGIFLRETAPIMSIQCAPRGEEEGANHD